MKKSFGAKMKVWALSALTIVAGGTFTSCSDEIAESNRFTFTGELISNHLKNNPDKYSNFCKILDQAKIGKKAGSMLTTLSTYGSYTCFAPTNEAIEKYINEKYNEYLESKELNAIDPTVKIVNTGITSPYLEDLSDSMATVIAKNHILEQGLTTIEVGNGAFPKKTMNRRSVMLGWTNDSLGFSVATVDGIEVAEQNIETENGYIHCIKGTLSPSDQPTSALLASQPAFTLFSEALTKTGFDEYLTKYEIDPDYDGLSNYGPPFQTQNKQEPPYPEAYNQGFTLLVETDELLADPNKNAMGLSIQSIEDLEWFAANWYGNITNKEKQEFDYKGDYTNPNNPLYKFVAYHILDRKLLYKSSKGPGGFLMENYQTVSEEGEIDKGKFDSEENMPTSYDRYDYFETALPFTSIKITKPFSNQTTQYTSYSGETGYLKDEIIANYAQEMGTRCVTPAMNYHINVVIEDETTTRSRTGLENFQQQAVNGMIFTIDKILIYNETEMAGNILDERMRWDVFSLFPELTNNDVRWMPEDATYTLVYIPENYCNRLRHRNTDTNIYYLRPHNSTYDGGYANYQGDEMLVTGKYDFEYRIPYVPAGTYEIRFGFSCSDARGVAQFYFDDKICGIPLDMRVSNLDVMGWFEESESEDDNRKNDKAMRNRGFMKAPASIWLGSYDKSKPDKSMRHAELAFRRIIGTYELEYGKDYWLRFKDVTEGGTDDKPNEFNQDYLEIVPVGILNNPAKPEDIY
ncbi:MAG: fasciclin domain-containing protein [Bacteroidaceae bacterium]|nr:fasciclin domain-containing protein [Bacteroidaceae bacterium]